MIIGIGSDICDARRIAKVIERHGERFLDRVFTETERAKADKRRNRAETYAKRFAAKEACSKALGTGLRAGLVAGHGRGQFAFRAADAPVNGRRQKAARGADAPRLRGAHRPHHDR
jgi:phosphopantetheine--protein transferase-like protein